MPEPTAHPVGSLCWADLLAPDPEAAEAFYTAVLGWDYVRTGAAFQHYRYATTRRQMVAGIARTDRAGASWIVAFAVRDADEAAERVPEAGGEVTEPPGDFGVQGRHLGVKDATGAHLGLWQPRAHMGAGLVGEPGALCWAELATPDPPAADAFYLALLGLKAADHPAAGDPEYAAYQLHGQAVAGRRPLPDPDGGADPGGEAGPGGAPAEGSPTGESPAGPGADGFWMPYFGVTDAREAAEAVTRKGGTVLVRSGDALGRGLAVLSDPWGATFAVLELAHES
ncbi:VOC family protein [Streptomyces sp. NPDC005438]|uniref:VOC family protein n=1 Tax=Streptomyces sp. NPDC005438 TaxID=3156880 RepID=UPI0033B14ED2